MRTGPSRVHAGLFLTRRAAFLRAACVASWRVTRWCNVTGGEEGRGLGQRKQLAGSVNIKTSSCCCRSVSRPPLRLA
ncbi:hypothetical protein BKA81DRAFT_367543, partial [Phyllosticta paracitricarpa]